MLKQLLFICFILTFPKLTLSQARLQPTGWMSKEPFKQNYFIENFGQFDPLVKAEQVKYVLNSNDQVFFTPKEVIWKIKELNVPDKEERDMEEAQEKGEKVKPKSTFVKLVWEGTNPDAVLEAREAGEGYYTFGEPGFENLKAKGYKRLVYKDLYANIDVEYSLPDTGGIKYKIIVRPGGDYRKIRMSYSGEEIRVERNTFGDVEIHSEHGDITDHAPVAWLDNENNVQIGIQYSIADREITFQLDSGYSHTRTLVIDPWTTTPTSLIATNCAFDIENDDYGNVYISGGSDQTKLAKYSATGTHLWTFTNPIGWPQFVASGGTVNSKFCLIPQSGSVLIGEGFSFIGPRVMKVSSAGLLQITSANFLGSAEIWQMVYSKCTGQVIGFGGSAGGSNNMQVLSDTNLTSSVASNFNGSADPYGDIGCVKMDTSGNVYALINGISTHPFANHIQKSLASTNYTPPVAWDIDAGFNLNEYQGFNYTNTCKLNAMALNDSYLFSYDGANLKAWDINTGIFLGSIVTDVGYSSSVLRTHEGVVVDKCNKVYAGGLNKIHIYDFTGTSFIPATPAYEVVPDEVFDLVLNSNGSILYACGRNFVSAISEVPCLVDQISFTVAVDSCLMGATLTNVVGGTPPYSFYWSNGSLSSSISGVPPGIYTVYVRDGSCVLHESSQTISIATNIPVDLGNDTMLCSSTPYILNSGYPGASHLWSTGDTLTSVVISASGNYSVIVQQNGCLSSDSVLVTINQVYTVSNPVNICNGTSYSINGHTYTSQGTYLDTLFTVYGCDSIISTNLTVNSIFSAFDTVQICDGNVYTFPDGFTSTIPTIHTSLLQTVAGCDSLVTTTLSVVTLDLGNDTSVCTPHTLDAGLIPGVTYLWSTGDTTSSILVDTTGNYSLILSLPGCSLLDTVSVNVSDFPTVDLGRDTLLCGNTDFVLDALNSSSVFQWSDGSSNQWLTVHSTGVYSVVVSNGICATVDTISVQFIPYPVISLPSDTIICALEHVALDSENPQASHTWSTGEHTQSITVYEEGMVTVEVDDYGCKSTRSIGVTKLEKPNLGSDTTFCGGFTIELNAQSRSGSVYLWSNGNTTPSILVDGPGTVWVMVQNRSCARSDSITFYQVLDASDSVFIPNVFTPNGDGMNEGFALTIDYLSSYEISVYNRWGTLIFAGDESTDFWTGNNSDGTPAPTGVYFWILQFRSSCPDSSVLKERRGIVSLVR